MSSFSIATLGREGVITDPIKGLNYIMSCFFFSKYSQTALYKGEVISLPHLIKRTAGSSTDLSLGLEKDLTKLLDRYFDSAQVQSTIIKDDPEIHLDLKVSVIPRDGSLKDTIDLGYALTVGESTFKSIINKMNNEVLY